jgi:hypothetical protein
MMKHIKIRVSVGEKKYFQAKADSYEIKLNDYARSVLIGVDRNRFIKPKSRIKFDSLVSMVKGTIKSLKCLGHNADFYLPLVESLELAVCLDCQIKKESIEFVADESPAMLHLYLSEQEIAQVDSQAKQKRQSRNDYIRGTLKFRSLPDYQVGEVRQETLNELSSIWAELGKLKTRVLFGDRQFNLNASIENNNRS